jgi:signal transduction histidine kinase
MLAETPGDLAEVVRGHPSLLETWADAEIGLRGEAALDEGNERQAQAIEARRESLAALRDELTDEAVLVQALQELVRAGDAEEALAQTLAAFPGLLTSDAQDALFRLAAEARARSDDALATRAVEYRAMLRKVREGLEEQ